MVKNSSFALVDAHVHMQDCFNLAQFFRSAFNNFKTTADQLGGDYSALIVLTEVSGTQRFSQLKELCASAEPIQDDVYGTWRLQETAESCSVEVIGSEGESFIIASGRQIVTMEKLEVLALFSDSQFPEGESLQQTIERVKKGKALPVIPWGVGKWLGKRGKLLSEFINSEHSQGVFLGDNGGRPILWPTPDHFILGGQRGMLVLPGTDPLPLAREVARVGSFGFYQAEKLSTDCPGAELMSRLLDANALVTPYGKLRAPLSFLSDQFGIRLK